MSDLGRRMDMRILPTLFVTLLALSFSWPSEGAIQGDGAVRALLWLVAAAAVGIIGIDRSVAAGSASKLSRIAVLLLCGGLWVSTWHVFEDGGDRRAALNLCFEWTALLAAWWLAVRLIEAGQRELIAKAVVGLSLGAAVLGLLQHHIIYPQRAAWYLEQRGLIDSEGAIDAAQARDVRADFARMNIPDSGPERALFENRLLHSTEPVGPHALTNTLGGQLAVALMLLVGGVLQQRRSVRSVCVGVIVGLVLAYCLVLTKSRTAWLGTFAGIFVLMILQQRSASWRIAQSARRLMVAAGLLLAVSVTAAVATGALDREVISEAPRSLQFRLMYWMGTAGVLKEQPLSGTGPGNFRQPYLKHKPDEASEQILDPHNIFLDSWVSGGLLSLFGMLLLIASVVLAVKRFAETRATNAATTADGILPVNENRSTALFEKRNLIAGCGIALLLAAGGHIVSGGDLPWESSGPLAWHAGLWIVPLAASVFAIVVPANASIVSAAAAVTALLVHLLAAGGLQISALMLLLLLLHAAVVTGTPQRPASAETRPENQLGARPTTRRFPIVAVGALIAIAAMIRLMVIPVEAASRQTQAALWHRQNADFDAATRSYRDAMATDPLDPKRHQQLADHLAYVLTGKIRRGIRVSAPEMVRLRTDLLATIDRWLALDEKSWQAWRLKASVNNLCSRAARNSGDFSDDLLTTAVHDWQQVVSLYPGNCTAWGELAETAWENSQPEIARSAAERALELDQINHQWGHQDRFLPPQIKKRMKQILTAD